jgi:hypothetical protein
VDVDNARVADLVEPLPRLGQDAAGVEAVVGGERVGEAEVAVSSRRR